MTRPKIKIQPDLIDNALDLISLGLVLFAFYFPFSVYSEMPDMIPSHFNAAGEVDALSGKEKVWWLPAITGVLYAGLFILNRYPHIFNYSVNITEENAEKQYTLATKLIRWINLYATGGLCYISYGVVNSAINTEESLGSWFLPVFLCTPILIIVVYMIQANKNQ